MANTSKRGFASMDNDKQRTIASKGGKAAHIKGTAHEWSSEEARAAGRKGGESRGTRNRLNEPGAITGMSPTNLSSEPSWVAEAGSSLRNPNVNTNSYPTAVPLTTEHIAPGLRTGVLAGSRVN